MTSSPNLKFGGKIVLDDEDKIENLAGKLCRRLRKIKGPVEKGIKEKGPENIWA